MLNELEQWMRHVEKSGQVKNKLVNDLTSDVFKNVRRKIETGSTIDDIYEYCKSQKTIFENDDKPLSKMCYNAFEQVRAKIWSIKNKRKLIATNVC